MTSVANTVKTLVPEADVYEYKVFDADLGEDVHGKRQSTQQDAHDSARQGWDTDVEEFLCEDDERESDSGSPEHQIEHRAECMLDEKSAEFSASWFEDKTAGLLKAIQRIECAHATTDGEKCLIAGYGLGGILLKQAGLAPLIGPARTS